MTKPRLVLRRSPEERRQYRQQHRSITHKHVGEVVGGTTAEMAAVCCCFPCSVVDLMILTMYKVPTGLYRNVMRRRHQQQQPSLTMKRSDSVSSMESIEDTQLAMHPAVIAAMERFMRPPEVDKDFMELENEMWAKFHDGGFWRSPSGRFVGLS
ncbi:hypothetical protein OSB04_009469 [Centaurea solstitialis]|uniref:Uncharacterized protein n=1 Tax=Centaurea solstitialis TaxID=347529 RepID=A0AA38WJQ9_9ASTR|nr:hypothetical protein OSB04_009469 [Centaurea solstitialis]